MRIPKPYITSISPEGFSQFEFKVDDFPDQSRDGQYYVRGAVCWPILNESTGISEGHIICAAQRIATGAIIVFEDTPFRCIDHIVTPEGKVEFRGLCSWFNAVWSKYSATLFYRSGNDETHRVYLLQILRSVNIKPSPSFPEVYLADEADAVNVLYNWRSRKKLVIDQDGKLHSDLIMWENTGRKVKMASVQALLILVNGYEKYPFRRVVIREE